MTVTKVGTNENDPVMTNRKKTRQMINLKAASDVTIMEIPKEILFCF